MIGYLSGKVLMANEKEAVVLVGGVGYKVFAPLPTLLSLEIDSPISLFVHTHVREDQITLFGFKDHIELELFTKLLSVSGIGPKSALAMLSVHSPASLADAIERGEAEVISHTPGIGKKTAEKIIIELKGKLVHMQNEKESDALFEVRLALEALGYSSKEIHNALSNVQSQGKSTSALIKEALSALQ